jgi:hypothetical protein
MIVAGGGALGAALSINESNLLQKRQLLALLDVMRIATISFTHCCL